MLKPSTTTAIAVIHCCGAFLFMFDFLGDMAKGIGRVIGTATGLVAGIPLKVIADTLGFTVEMVKEAMDAGCETYEEIKDFWDGR